MNETLNLWDLRFKAGKQASYIDLCQLPASLLFQTHTASHICNMFKSWAAVLETEVGDYLCSV